MLPLHAGDVKQIARTLCMNVYQRHNPVVVERYDRMQSQCLMTLEKRLLTQMHHAIPPHRNFQNAHIILQSLQSWGEPSWV